MKTHFLIAFVLLNICPLLQISAQTGEALPDKSMAKIRLAYFLDYPNEVSITLGSLGTIKSIAAGSVTAFSEVPAGPLAIDIKDRFTGKQLFSQTASIKAGEITNVVILGSPGNPEFSPKLLSIVEDEKVKMELEKLKKATPDTPLAVSYFTFINCDQLGPADFQFNQAGSTVAPFKLLPGEQKTITEVPVSSNSFSVKTVKDKDQYDPSTIKSPPSVANHSAYYLVFLFRPSAKGIAAQTYVTDMNESSIYGDEQ